MLRNLIVIVGAIAISSAYLWGSPTLVPEKYALVANFIVMPSVLGLLAGYLLAGRLPLKLLFLLPIPIAHILVFGPDPGKPGLESILALMELPPLWIGCLTAHMLQKKVQSAAARNGYG